MTDCIVVGAGLSGLSAALTLAQHRISVEVLATLLTDTRVGKLAGTPYYPGGSATATGQSLVDHIVEQLKESRAPIITGTVQSLVAANATFELTLTSGERRNAKGIIAATGIVHHGHAALPGEDAFFGKGVFYNMQVDGPLYAGKTLVATGKSAAIVEQLIDCHRWFEKTYLVVPATKLDLAEDLVQRLQQCSTVEIIYSASIKEVHGLTTVGSVQIQAAGQERQLHAQAVWIPTHTHYGNSNFLDGVVDLSESKTPLVNPQLGTSVAGIFACGDLLCAEYQHPSIAAAQGVIAAYSCERYLRSI